MGRKAQKRPTDWWLDESVWPDLFEPLFAQDGSLADHAARLFNALLLEFENGRKDTTHAAIFIENALRSIFPYTSVGRSCWILFLVSLSKDFPNQPDTLATLTEAMKRTRAALERGPVSQAKRRKTSRRK